MNRLLNSAVALLVLAFLGGCGGAGNTATPYAPTASRTQSLLPNDYKFHFENKTSESVVITRSDEACMKVPPPETFTVEPGKVRRFEFTTECVVDPSKFTLTFASGNKIVKCKYEKYTGNPWTYKRFDENGLALSVSVEQIKIGPSVSTWYVTKILP
jgi:hypothetical protein